jgi:hypothetical protein
MSIVGRCTYILNIILCSPYFMFSLCLYLVIYIFNDVFVNHKLHLHI